MGDFALKRTTNYSLPTWEKSDFIKMDDFNDLTHKLDSALKAESDARGEADGTASERITAIAQALGTGGQNCRIAYGTYTGSGGYGSGSPNSLTFDFTPLLVVVGNIEGTNYVAWPTVMIRGADSHGDSDQQRIYITWNDRSISWYNPDHPSYQNNVNRRQYNYVAIGYSAQ